jgi:triosephosphate isomerase
MTVIAANWKMNKNLDEALDFIASLEFPKNIETIICPPSIALSAIAKAAPMVSIAAQHIHQAPNGAFTGELSAEMVKSAGASHILIGHSERRQLFAESDALVNLKTKRALELKLKAIICIGESLKERESGNTLSCIKTQLSTALEGVESSEILIAYEPVWAIGTGLSASPEQAQEVHAFIRAELKEKFAERAKEIPILYGGSVKATNIKDLLAQKDINGALIGGASLKSDEFNKIMETASEQTL